MSVRVRVRVRFRFRVRVRVPDSATAVQRSAGAAFGWNRTEQRRRGEEGSSMEASTSTSHVSPSIGPLDPVADYCDDEASQLAISLDQIMNFNTKANIAEAEEQDKEKDKENEGSLPHRHLLPSAFSSSSSSQRNKQRNRRRRRRKRRYVEDVCTKI